MNKLIVKHVLKTVVRLIIITAALYGLTFILPNASNIRINRFGDFSNYDLVSSFFNTFKFLSITLLISLVIGVSLGILIGIQKKFVLDIIVKIITYLTFSFPPFLLSLSLMLFVYSKDIVAFRFYISQISMCIITTFIVLNIVIKSIRIQSSNNKIKNALPYIIKALRNKIDIIIFLLIFFQSTNITVFFAGYDNISIIIASILFISILACVIKLILDILYEITRQRVKAEGDEMMSLKQTKGFLKQKNTVIGSILLVIFIVISLSAGIISDYNEDAINSNIQLKLQKPNSDNIFGTDPLGRDIFARILFGIRNTIKLTFLTAIIIGIIGGILGISAGFFGGIIDKIIMFIMDIIMTIPSIVLLLMIFVFSQTSTRYSLIIGLIVAFAPIIAKSARKITKYIIKENKSCQLDKNITIGYIAKKSIGMLGIKLLSQLATISIFIISMGYIGLGFNPPEPNLGDMVNMSRGYVVQTSYMFTIPAITIVILLFTLNLLNSEIFFESD